MRPNYIYNATVVRIVDADTIDVAIDLGLSIFAKQRLRLARVDAWETRGTEREWGLAAKARVEELIPPGTIVVVQTSKTGKYGRYIAEVLVPQENIDKAPKLQPQSQAEQTTQQAEPKAEQKTLYKSDLFLEEGQGRYLSDILLEEGHATPYIG